MTPSLIIGTRGSRLALTQTATAARMLRDANPGLAVETRILKTKGDRVTEAPLASFGGEGVFVKELERALLTGDIDLAVHSLKDLPAILPEGLIIAGVPERADARDALVSRRRGGLDALPRGARVGTGSLRRRAQLLAYRPDLGMVGLRGNLDTRLRKLDEMNLEAVILAAAGLDRMGWGDRVTERLSCTVCLPAAGQGALAVETRRDDARARRAVRRIDHAPSALAVTAERAFLRSLGGGCQTPVGAWARMEGAELRLDGLIADTEGAWVVRDTLAGFPGEAEALGRRLAEMLRRRTPEGG